MYRTTPPALFASLAIVTVLVAGCDKKSTTAPSAIQTPAPESGSTLLGAVANLSGTRSSFQFVVNGTAVRGDDNSAFDPGSPFNEMGDGLQVQVTGTQQPGYVYASRVVLVAQPISLGGTIASRSGTPPQLTVTVGGQTVTVSGLTDVRRKGNPQNAKAIATGQTVDVGGRMRADGSIVAAVVNILADAAGGGFWMEATIGAVSGSCPRLQMTADGYGIDTDAQTVFSAACDQLTTGDRIEVIGIVRPDFSVMVTSIKKI